MYLMPPTSPMSCTRTMFLCVTLRASSSSCLNRRSSMRAVSGSAATSGRIVFRATTTLEHLVPGLVDRAHAAGAEQFDDLVAEAQLLPDQVAR